MSKDGGLSEFPTNKAGAQYGTGELPGLDLLDAEA